MLPQTTQTTHDDATKKRGVPGGIHRWEIVVNVHTTDEKTHTRVGTHNGGRPEKKQ
eukprot:GDKH01015313.1.p6 GENE.GDKH01015313.1~~GDKH01015313.1.p6  ORF type:complete len:56 (-),score=0.40 GDKH01015313.1:178-345(-)